MQKEHSVDVEFTVTCAEFRVPGWPGLVCSATFRSFGTVTYDRSGDSETPHGAPEVVVHLGDVKDYTITHDDGHGLPEWLQAHLCIEFALEFDDAFISAIGGMAALESMAIEEAELWWH